MNKLLREFFLLRRGEQRALIMVSVFLLLATTLRVWIERRPLQEFKPDAAYLASMEAIKKQDGEMVEAETRRYAVKRTMRTTSEEFSPFVFDPNRISYDSLMLMHVPGFFARNLISYREAGGSFYTADGLKRIYGIDSQLFLELLPYVDIALQRDTMFIANDLVQDITGDIPGPIDLNKADSAELAEIPGISPWFATRIIKYRNLLGGYHDTLQLWEVYGMDTTRYVSLLGAIVMDTLNIRKIDVNHASFRELVAHPYIDREDTYAILKFREFMDSIPDPIELVKNQIIDHDRFRRLAPYFNKN